MKMCMFWNLPPYFGYQIYKFLTAPSAASLNFDQPVLPAAHPRPAKASISELQVPFWGNPIGKCPIDIYLYLYNIYIYIQLYSCIHIFIYIHIYSINKPSFQNSATTWGHDQIHPKKHCDILLVIFSHDIPTIFPWKHPHDSPWISLSPSI